VYLTHAGRVRSPESTGTVIGRSRPVRAARGAGGYLRLVAAGEPYRLLFPLGAAIGIAGVMMWPLYVWKVISFYPGIPHARVMIEGFLGCFVAGFLGTVLPRLLGAPKVTVYEALGLAAAWGWTAWLQWSGQTLWGDLAFFATMGIFVLLLGVRVILRRDTPPPAFVLVAMGMLCALAGSFGLAAAQVAPGLVAAWVLPFSKLLLYQGFVLLPAMGVGAFLLPRFFGLPNRQSFPESLALPAGWISRSVFAAACGLLVIAGFVVEAAGFARWGFALRAAVMFVFFFLEVPFHRAGFGGGSLAFGLRIALVSLPAGFLLLAVLPERTPTFLHVVFITGFSLLALIVASRVILGHSGQSGKFSAPIWPVRILCALLVLAMLTRVTADWMPGVQWSHYAYAAIAWTAGVLVWAVCILPGIGKGDEAG